MWREEKAWAILVARATLADEAGEPRVRILESLIGGFEGVDRTSVLLDRGAVVGHTLQSSLGRAFRGTGFTAGQGGFTLRSLDG